MEFPVASESHCPAVPPRIPLIRHHNIGPRLIGNPEGASSAPEGFSWFGRRSFRGSHSEFSERLAGPRISIVDHSDFPDEFILLSGILNCFQICQRILQTAESRSANQSRDSCAPPTEPPPAPPTTHAHHEVPSTSLSQYYIPFMTFISNRTQNWCPIKVIFVLCVETDRVEKNGKQQKFWNETKINIQNWADVSGGKRSAEKSEWECGELLPLPRETMGSLAVPLTLAASPFGASSPLDPPGLRPSRSALRRRFRWQSEDSN